jgi:hypothetical protein
MGVDAGNAVAGEIVCGVAVSWFSSKYLVCVRFGSLTRPVFISELLVKACCLFNSIKFVNSAHGGNNLH